MIDGKMVLEASAVVLDKGDALQRLRQMVGATGVVFMGDDTTDELAFAVVESPDAAVKVGPGPTRAQFRVESPAEVAHLLAGLTDARADHLFGAPSVPIDHHSFLSNQRAHALVDPKGRIVWFCHPNVDSGAVFAELLGSASNGYFSIAPADGGDVVEQQYVEGSLALETRWAEVTVADTIEWPAEATGPSSLLRMVTGTAPVRIEFSPRLDYGRAPTGLQTTRNGLRVNGAIEPLLLHAPGIEWTIEADGQHEVASALVEPGPDGFVIELSGAGIDRSVGALERRAATIDRWRDWLDTLVIPATYAAQVRQSAVVLKGLCHPAGSVFAAASCSLPSDFGGTRNWDYRYCWPRDSALAMQALAELGRDEEPLAFLRWLANVVSRLDNLAMVHPIYAFDGSDVPTEAEIGQLRGYAGSKPVRVGNAAEHQVQFDAFGAIAELVDTLSARGVPVAEFAPMLEHIVEVVSARWREPDNGIWEIRLAPRQHTHSKTMCWVTVDRVIGLFERLGLPVQPRWALLRDDIREDVLTNGFDPEAGCFTAWYGGVEPDAATLHVGLSGLVAADDPRFISTVKVIEDQLRSTSTVRRYRYADGLPGHDGGFHLCTSWLIDAYLSVGRRDDAVELFEAMLATAGPTGLFAEGWDAENQRALGNFPQAYSHLGIIRNAVRLG
jgi:GH15 family glucan-1,4-alpha-glucosidase